MTPPGDMPVLGEPDDGGLWRRARDRCAACGGEGLLDEGYVRVKDRPGGEVEWVGPVTTAPFHFGFTAETHQFPLRARRCRECRHVQFYAEDE